MAFCSSSSITVVIGEEMFPDTPLLADERKCCAFRAEFVPLVPFHTRRAFLREWTRNQYPIETLSFAR